MPVKQRDTGLEGSVRFCVSNLKPMLESVRRANGNRLPDGLIDNHYVLGYLEGMLGVLLDRCGLDRGVERGHAVLDVFSHLMQKNPLAVGEKLVALHEDEKDVNYHEGIHDGTDRLLAVNDGRREEVSYRLMHHLEPYL